MKKPRVAVASLGCKLNAYEAEATRSALTAAGYEAVEFGEDAEVCLVYTCTVTGRADSRSRNLLRRAAKAVTPGGRVIAAGCYARTDAEKLLEIEGVTDVAPGPVAELPGILDKTQENTRRWSDLTEGDSFSYHTRAFLKVQDGCDGVCSFCKVRIARGPAQSRPAADARLALGRLVEAGHREVVLTGVHLGYWGKEFGQTLSDLLRELLTAPGLGRIRLSSMEPQELTDELLTLIAQSEGRMAPHLHVPLQSGSDVVLSAMRRGYRLEQAMERMATARRLIPNLGLGLDVLTSFPGETKADFNATLDAAKECGASYLHVFSYSPRPGTPAADYPGQLAVEVKKERSRLARRLSRQLAMEYAKSQVGKELSVLVERHRAASGRLLGVAGNYLRCELIDLPDDQAGKLITARVIEPLNEPVHGPAKVLCQPL